MCYDNFPRKATFARFLFSIIGMAFVFISTCIQAKGQPRVLHLGVNAITVLDPLRTTDKSTSDILRSICEGLTTYSEDGKVIPGSAVSWHARPDKAVWDFKLRPGMKWSDGQTMSADDWVWSFRTAIQYGDTPSIQPLLLLENAVDVRAGRKPPSTLGVAATGLDGLRMTLSAPYPELPGALAQQIALPRPRHLSGKLSGGKLSSDVSVCNGPFVLVGIDPGRRVNAVRNPLYHSAASIAADEVDWMVVEDVTDQARMFKSGMLHVSSFLMAGGLEWARSLTGAHVNEAPSNMAYFLLPNFRQPPFSEHPELARALTMVLDRKLIATRTGGGLGSETYVPDYQLGGSSRLASWSEMSRAARLSEARLILSTAGYSPEKPLHLKIHFSDVSRQQLNRRVITAVAAQWSKLGIKVEMVERNVSEHLDLLKEGSWSGLARRSWISYAPDNYMKPLMSEPLPGWNGYADPSFLNAMADAFSEPDPGKRSDKFAHAQVILLDAGAVIPLLTEVSRVLTVNDLEGWTDNPLRMHLPRYMRLGRWE